MRLTDLLNAAELDDLVQVSGQADIRTVTADSRQAGPGACFIAVRGPKADGHEFIPAAVKKGCAAVVCQDASAAKSCAAYAVVGDSRRAAARLAQAICGWPVRRLTCVGVTGTNGKTTVTSLIAAILRHAGSARVGVIGTVGYETARGHREAENTTPGPDRLAELTAEMVADGCRHLVMEVSSHALDQGRVEGIDFRVAVFTNLTGDHLDYHGTMQNYLGAKQRLFASLSPDAAAVVNADDPAGASMAEATAAKVCTYGIDRAADVRAKIVRMGLDGTEMLVTTAAGQRPLHTRLIGRHNVYNVLAALAAAQMLGIAPGVIDAALSAAEPVAGRMQRIAGVGVTVFVDYAHTDDALNNVLAALRPLVAGRLWLVFGCGGDRDRTKRPRMARAAEAGADRIVVTSDNPRNEDPQAIIAEMLVGLSAAGKAKTTVEPDRGAAIALAISQAAEGDVILLAGKGHEKYQIIGQQRLEFDDCAVAAECLRERRGRVVGRVRT